MTIPNIYKLNVEEQNKRYPNTFHILSREARESLRPGDNAKITFKADELPNGRRDVGETMWVEVVERQEDGSYVGQLNNDPFVFLGHLNHLDRIVFGPEHVRLILRKDARDEDIPPPAHGGSLLTAKNRNGISFQDWAAAAGIDLHMRPNEEGRRGYDAWLDGLDPKTWKKL